ncbi:MAG TPA: hypothetical protein EYG30_11615 [Planctomycetes bacterium]|nr:hypothetical protein [Planctomycetota bacterium]HIL52883.1 hypothetical protein [Planctomycetota bacterium]
MTQARVGQRPQEEVDAVLREVLGREEFQEEATPVSDFFADVIDWIDGFFGGGPNISRAGIAEGAELLLWIVVGLGALGLLWFLFTVGVPGIGSWWARKRALTDASLVIERVSTLRQAARSAEADQDWTRALRLHFFAALVGLGERGDLAYRDAWTHRELLARGQPTARVEQALAPLMGELDEHSFGLRVTVAEDVRRFSSLCDQLLGEDAA